MLLDEPTGRHAREWTVVIVLLCTACLNQQHGDYCAHPSTISPVSAGMGRAQVYTEDEREREIQYHHKFYPLPGEEPPPRLSTLELVSATLFACASATQTAPPPEFLDVMEAIATTASVSARGIKLATRWILSALEVALKAWPDASDHELYGLAEAMLHNGEVELP